MMRVSSDMASDEMKERRTDRQLAASAISAAPRVFPTGTCGNGKVDIPPSVRCQWAN